MTYSVSLSSKANADLQNIYQYIAYRLLSPINAAAQLSRLEEVILSLEEMPQRYRRYDKEPWHSKGIRIVPVDHYCILYYPDQGRKTVTILRIVYGRMDLDRVLREYNF